MCNISIELMNLEKVNIKADSGHLITNSIYSILSFMLLFVFVFGINTNTHREKYMYNRFITDFEAMSERDDAIENERG